MLKTQNYGFNKPELSDSPPDITVMNPNWDTIDKKIKENTDAIAQNSEAIGTVKTEITKMDISWDKISGKPNSFVPSAHSHTKADIGLGSVQNYGVATQAQVDEGKANNLYVTPLSLAGLKQSVVNGKQAIVNAINDSLGYNSGLTINNKHEEYSWWIKNKVSPPLWINFKPQYTAGVHNTNLCSAGWVTTETGKVTYNTKNISLVKGEYVSIIYFNTPIVAPNGGAIAIDFSGSTLRCSVVFSNVLNSKRPVVSYGANMFNIETFPIPSGTNYLGFELSDNRTVVINSIAILTY